MLYADPYAVPGQWRKGNLHTHTTRSDGKATPEEAVYLYQDKGYDFLAISDHDVFTDPAPLQAQTRLTLIPGFEWSNNSGSRHILCSGVRQVYGGTYQEVLDSTQALGGLAVLCHPNWIRPDLWPPDLMASLRYYAGIEVYNHVITRLEGSPLATDDWDTLLTAGLRVWGFASEDAHKIEDMGHCANMVLSPTAGANDLLYAMSNGRFYASAGLVFADIGLRSGAIHVALPTEATVRFVGPGGELLAEIVGQHAGYEPHGETYVRVEAEDREGCRAWSQPFWRLTEAG